jgi:hypothetical protein
MSGQRACPDGETAASSTPSPGPKAAAAQDGRDRDARAGRHGDHAARVTAGDCHARFGTQGQPVTAAPAEHAGDRLAGNLGSRAAGIVNPGLWASPQNPHKSGSAAMAPTEIPRTKRHYPAQDGTAANMALLALTSLYAGSAGLTPLTAPVVRAATDLLLTGRL